MTYYLLWIFLLILQNFTASFPVANQYDLGVIGVDQGSMSNSPKLPRYDDSPDSSDEKVISVRITSSVAVGRGRGKSLHRPADAMTDREKNDPSKVFPIDVQHSTIMPKVEEMALTRSTEVPPNLIGANIEYIKQLNAKKESRDHSADPVHPFELMVKGHHNEDELSARIDKFDEEIPDVPLARKVPSTADANKFQEQKSIDRFQYPERNPSDLVYFQNRQKNMTDETLHPKTKLRLEDNSQDVSNTTSSNLESDTKGNRDLEELMRIGGFPSKNYHTDDSVAEPSIKSIEFAKYNEEIENHSSTATMLPVRPPNNVQGLNNRPQNDRRNNQRLTTVSFNIVHDTSKPPNTGNEPSSSYASSRLIPEPKQFYDSPKIYSQPAQVYSEPAKFYSEPAKIYSEPAKIYSEPAKVYSEPAKVYSEPSKFYSEPASLHLEQNLPSSIAPNYSPWQTPQRPFGSNTINTTPISTVTNTFQQGTTVEHQPEKNYEVDEKISVLTDGRSHGVQPDTTTEKCKQDTCKVGYVLEGRQFKKYRVEERTPDGFIVGEYGVVRNEDGALRGVRYTADGDASPRLIHDALMKFLQLT
ncbi:hypothetical protein B5X24_HaOG209846 [Helicoverpa armigera]|nr:hypothetical protein B5X24_HaOG209846 [Helicoverpa armigera]